MTQLHEALDGQVPSGTTTVAVKITDMLGEELLVSAEV